MWENFRTFATRNSLFNKSLIVMKKFFFVIFACLLTVAAYSAELNAKQTQLRSDIMTFLKQEGFVPEIDSDGDIMFKREGKKWYVSFYANDVNPMYISLQRSYLYDETYTKDALAKILYELNAYKGVKMRLMNRSYTFAAELYLQESSVLTNAFYKLIKQIDSMEDEMETLITNGPSQEQAPAPVVDNRPLKFESAYVACVDADDKVVVDYGKSIYSYQTRYLKLKMYTTVKTAGNYTFNVKFFGADGNLSTSGSSPAGYSYNTTVKLDAGYREVLFPGWGSNTAGFWTAGKYRMEIYLNGEKFGEKEFTVY